MKRILKLNSSYQVIDGEGIDILDALPPDVYELKFAKNRGFWFEKLELEPFTGKVYGDQERMQKKVIRCYNAVSGRNLGVLLSGSKGTGKSLFVRNLAVKLSETIPVIIVKENCGPAMLSALTDIKGRAAIVFDEFEKMFRKDDATGSRSEMNESDVREQEAALSFFDGVETKQEKLLLLTVNDTWNLSKYLLGRPGRIHYHFRMAIPTPAQIESYLADNLTVKVSEGIRSVATTLSSKAVSWDSLSAVVSELNSGETLADTLSDLNIRTETNSMIRLVVRGVFDNGHETDCHIDVEESTSSVGCTFRVKADKEKCGADMLWTDVEFNVNDLKPTGELGEFEVSKFTQGDPEDCDDKKVPNAPRLIQIKVYRRTSFEALEYNRRLGMRNIGMLM